MRKIFKDMWMKTVAGDEELYFKHENNRLEGMILTHELENK